jgi:hypothetical protein
MSTAPFTGATDARAAQWVVDRVRGFGGSVLSLVPAGFAAYVRVFHPAYRGPQPDPIPVSWAHIAAANRRRAHGGMQLGAITGSERHEGEGQPGVFDDPPATGTLPPEVLGPLASALTACTTTPERCWFAVWEGYAGLSAGVRAAPTFTLPGRTHHLLTGPVAAVGDLARAVTGEGWFQSPSLWWPEDRAWCVATDVDLKSTYIGGSVSAVRHVEALPGVEAWEVAPDRGIDWLSDRLNPPPPEAVA